MALLKVLKQIWRCIECGWVSEWVDQDFAVIGCQRIIKYFVYIFVYFSYT